MATQRGAATPLTSSLPGNVLEIVMTAVPARPLVEGMQAGTVTRDIAAGCEVLWDYGDRYWAQQHTNSELILAQALHCHRLQEHKLEGSWRTKAEFLAKALDQAMLEKAAAQQREQEHIGCLKRFRGYATQVARGSASCPVFQTNEVDVSYVIMAV
jgi:hypothetical protein